MFEQLVNVEALLGETDLVFVGFPLKIKGGNGSPTASTDRTTRSLTRCTARPRVGSQWRAARLKLAIASRMLASWGWCASEVRSTASASSTRPAEWSATPYT